MSHIERLLHLVIINLTRSRVGSTPLASARRTNFFSILFLEHEVINLLELGQLTLQLLMLPHLH